MTEERDEPVEEQQVEDTPTKKELINHFLIFRVGGSLVLALIVGIILTIFENRPGEHNLLVGIGVVTFINIPIQLYTLFKAYLYYRKHRIRE